MPNVLMDLPTFRIDYPEFVTADDTYVQRYLDKASEQFDAPTWGTYLQTGHGLLTAHWLGISPSGEFSRLATDKGETTYGKEFSKLQAAVTSCIRVF